MCKFVKKVIDSNFFGKINVVSGNSKTIIEIAEIITKKIDSKIIFQKKISLISKYNFDNSKFKIHFPTFVFTNIKTSISKYCNISI